LPSDGSEPITGALSGTSASFTGTVLAGGNPKFRAHQSVAQSIPSASFTPISFDAVDFNVGSVGITGGTKITPTVWGLLPGAWPIHDDRKHDCRDCD